MKYLLYEHDDSSNHGCEAIIRSTSKLLNLNRYNATLFSLNPAGDQLFGIDRILNVKNQLYQVKKDSFIDYAIRIKTRIDKASYDENIDKYLQKVISSRSGATQKQKNLNAVRGCVALSIGGDNYCYGGIQYFINNHNVLVNNGIDTVLWGCSLNHYSFTQEGIEDLNNFRIITPREKITYDLLIQHNISTEIIKCADPAFSLDTEHVEVPWENKTVIGINCSPMILHFGNNENLILINYIKLIEYITKELNMKVALIPHVNYSSSDSDYEVLKRIHKRFINDTYLIGDNYNCCQLKHIISTCDFFIGARTHATIAAYSTYVPTLVVGYSTKATGIAIDLFDEEYKDYVVDIIDIKDENKLKNKFIKLYKKKQTISKHLESFIPNYKNTIQLGVEAVKALTI